VPSPTARGANQLYKTKTNTLTLHIACI
jgi:hypothetical protein